MLLVAVRISIRRDRSLFCPGTVALFELLRGEEQIPYIHFGYIQIMRYDKNYAEKESTIILKNRKLALFEDELTG